MITIFGSGIIGLFIARKLLLNGKKVKIIDLDNNRGNSTDASVGMLAPLIEARPYENNLFNLMIESKKIWDKFLKNKSFIKNTGLKNNSSLMIATNKDEEESILFKKKFVEKLGFFPEILSAKQTIKIEPHLNSNLKCSLFFKKNNQINAHLLKRYLIKDVKKMGADFLFFDQINKISFSSQEIRFNNKKISSEKIIVACGVWSNELLKKSFKVLFPMRPLKGVSMLFKTKKRLFINNIWYRNIYIAPRDNNFLAVGATEDEKGFESFVTLDEIFTLCNSLWEYLPEIEKLQFINTFVGLRSVLSDGNPVIGSLKKNNDIICAFGHFRHGILLAPITAKIVSDIVLDYKINENLTFFSPNRFNL